MAGVEPWIIDAKDIEIPFLGSFQKSLFHTNSQIARFLGDAGRQQALVVGPKGFGKTLVLKLKRNRLRGSGIKLFPSDALLDKPIGTPQIFASKDLKDMLEDPSYWRHSWLIALTLGILKYIDIDKSEERILKPEFQSPTLNYIVQSQRIASCCDIFDRVLALSRAEYFRAYEDLRKDLIPLFRLIHSPVAVFIDNVDEYFEQAMHVGAEGRSIQNVRTSYWHNAQVGLAHAARELNGLNNHVKVCASIRQEVFQALKHDDPMGMQLRGSALELTYDREDLIEILKKNIQAEASDNLFVTSDGEVFQSFFGPDAIRITNTYTGEEERVEDFFLRHTLWRPRDIAALGKRISEITTSRRTPSKIKEIINQVGSSIAHSYLRVCLESLSQRASLRSSRIAEAA